MHKIVLQIKMSILLGNIRIGHFFRKLGNFILSKYILLSLCVCIFISLSKKIMELGRVYRDPVAQWHIPVLM